MIKKIIATILSIFILMTFLTGCGSDNSTSSQSTGDLQDYSENIRLADTSEINETTITFWHYMGGSNGEVLNSLIEKFNEENEYGITVIGEYQGVYEDALVKFKSAKLGNMGDDIDLFQGADTKFLVESGWIVPMQDLIELDDYDISDLEPNILAYYTLNGKLYPMPFNSSTPIMYYNKDMFEQAGITEIPTSLEEILLIADDLLNNSDAQEVIALGVSGWYFEQFMSKQGLEYSDNNNGRDLYSTKVVFDENGGAENMLTLFNEIFEKGYSSLGVGESDLTNFSAGKAAIGLGSTSKLKQTLADVGERFEVGTAYFPSVYASDQGGISVSGGAIWALDNNDPARLRATWEFVKFLSSTESQAYWSAETGYFPIRISSQEEEVFKQHIENYPQFKTALDQLHDSAPEYAGHLLGCLGEVRVSIANEIENMAYNGIDVETTLKNIIDTVSSLIEEYNSLNY